MSKETFIEIYQANIRRTGADALLQYLEKTDFFTAPASTKFHESYKGGLCEHSVNVYNELKRLLKAYPEIKCSDETAAIVSLLHDVCKIGCYKTEMRNTKENGAWVQVPFYVFKENFCYGGHGSKSVYVIERFIRLNQEEAVTVNCHMGAWDRTPNDYSLGGAYEQYPLAWLLHVADEAATFIKNKEENK